MSFSPTLYLEWNLIGPQSSLTRRARRKLMFTFSHQIQSLIKYFSCNINFSGLVLNCFESNLKLKFYPEHKNWL